MVPNKHPLLNLHNMTDDGLRAEGSSVAPQCFICGWWGRGPLQEHYIDSVNREAGRTSTQSLRPTRFIAERHKHLSDLRRAFVSLDSCS